MLSEIRSETWSSGRIEASIVFLCFWFVCVSFAVSRSYLKQMKVLEERLMYLFIVFCKELLCVSIPFWLKDFHLCVYIFRFPPSLTLFSILYQCCINRLIAQFHPISPICAPNPVSSLELLCSWLFAVRCTSKRGDFYVTFSLSNEFTAMHNGASLMSSDPNGLLMPSGQMVSIEVWSNPN